jgi:DNA-binding response OmpR family regulator
MPQTILICEDDSVLAATLQEVLRARDYRVAVTRCGREALDYLQQDEPALLVLDLMLPDMDGFDVCRLMRCQSSVPVVMISGRAGEIDRVVGLEVGADDYVVKPFGLAEFVARVDAHLRRASLYSQRRESQGRQELGELCLDCDSHQVFLRGRLLHVTPKEYELLSVLAESRGSVVRSAQLLMRVWGYDSSIRTRTLDVHIARLRAKLEDDAHRPVYILTVPGVGYKLCAPEALPRAA